MATEHSVDITQAISRFEAAWARGDSPELDSFIPQDDTDNVELIAELIAVDLERRLKAGETIRVESYLERFPGLVGSPAEVVNLIVAEYQHRCRQTPELAADEYLQRFPQYRDLLLARLSATDETLIGSERFVTQTITPAATDSVDETAASLLKRMTECGLVSEQTIEKCRETLPADKQQDNQQLIHTLLEQGHVTAWQLKQLRAGLKTFVLENGRYLLLDELGKGGMGTVYRARHIGLNREVALKTIDPKNAQNSQLIGRFQREITVCAKLQHEHIVPAYDMGCHGGVHFLVLEYVEGLDLASLVKQNGPMWPDEAAAIALQAAAALAYAHAEGIVHRDIKPHNILLSSSGVIKILDMGLARVVGEMPGDGVTSLTQTGTMMGTVDYMAAEQADDAHTADARSDVYSLGATLYFLLTGRPPFAGGTLMGKLKRLSSEEPQPLGQLRPDCPRELAEVVSRMMAKRADQRYQTASDVVRALQPFAAERIVGRAVVTAAVQTAAEIDMNASPTETVAITPFEFAAADTVATSVMRRKKESPLGKWLIGAAVVVPLLIGLGIWAATSGNEKKPREDPPAVEVAKVSPDLNKPPSQYRITPRMGHFGSVQHVAWSPDDKQFATAATDGEIRVWDAGDPSNLMTRTVYRGHHALPTGLVWFPDGESIASVDGAQQLHVWNKWTGKQLFVVDEPVDSQPVIRPGGRELAFESPDGVVLWSIEGKRRIRLLTKTNYTPIQYSPSGRYLAIGYPSHTGGSNIQVWDVDDWKAETPRVTIPYKKFLRANIAHAFNRLLFIDDNLMALTEDGVVKYFDLKTGTVKRSIVVSKGGEKRFGHAFSQDGDTLMVWTDESIQRINLDTGENAEHAYPSLKVSLSWFNQSQVSPAADRQILFNSLSDASTFLFYIRENRQFALPISKLNHVRQFRLQGRRFLNIDPGPNSSPPLFGWDLQTGEPLYDFPRTSQYYTVRSDGALAVLNGGYNNVADHHVEIWPVPGSPVERQQVYPELEQVEDNRQSFGTGFINDGTQVWMLSQDKQRIRVWNSQTGKVERSIETKFVRDSEAMYFLPDSRWWFRQRLTNDAKDVEIVLEPFNDVSTTPAVALNMPGTRSAYPVAVSRDDSRIVTTTNDRPYRVFVWNTFDGKQLAELTVPKEMEPLHQIQTFKNIQLSSSGRYLLLYDQIYDLNAKPPKVLWESSTHSIAYFNAALLGDERYLVVRLGDRIEVWDWQKNEKRVTIYLLPEQQWFVFNHETRCWNGSEVAFRYVKYLHRDAAGKQEWIAPHRYEYRAEWKNEPSKAGLGAPGGE